MADDNQFFRPIRDFYQRTVVSCSADDALVDIVAQMRERSISCVVVVTDHSAIDYSHVKSTARLVVDSRNALSKAVGSARVVSL